MTYEGASRVRHGKWSRRSFIQATGAGIAAGAVGGVFPNRVKAAGRDCAASALVLKRDQRADPEQSDQGSGLYHRRSGHGLAANASRKLLNQGTDQYEIGEWYYHDLGLVGAGEGVSANRTLNGSRIGTRSPILQRLES